MLLSQRSTYLEFGLQAAALRHCQNEAPQVVRVEPDPIASSAVYFAEPCNSTVTASVAATTAAVGAGGGEAAALAAQVAELKKQIDHKDALLRVRNNQLAQVDKLLDEREVLWNASLARVLPCFVHFSLHSLRD
jgi:hypothetical protein